MQMPGWFAELCRSYPFADVLSSAAPCKAEPEAVDQAIMSVLGANEALLHQAVLRRPLSVLK